MIAPEKLQEIITRVETIKTLAANEHVYTPVQVLEILREFEETMQENQRFKHVLQEVAKNKIFVGDDWVSIRLRLLGEDAAKALEGDRHV